jgi:hypothetical protein
MIITTKVAELEMNILHIADQLDGDGDLRIQITGIDGDSVVTYLTQDQIKQLIDHLNQMVS